jgi:hypothetical protein
MAGSLVISTLNNDTGVLATQNGMTGIAKAWVKINNLGSGSLSIGASFNVSSVVYTASGIFTVNFTTSMPDANYAPQMLCSQTGVTTNVSGTPTTSAVAIQTVNPATAAQYVPANGTWNYMVVFGN